MYLMMCLLSGNENEGMRFINLFTRKKRRILNLLASHQFMTNSWISNFQGGFEI